MSFNMSQIELLRNCFSKLGYNYLGVMKNIEKMPQEIASDLINKLVDIITDNHKETGISTNNDMPLDGSKYEAKLDSVTPDTSTVLPIESIQIWLDEYNKIFNQQQKIKKTKRTQMFSVLLENVKALKAQLQQTPDAFGYVSNDVPEISDSGITLRQQLESEAEAAFDCIITTLKRLQNNEIDEQYARFALRMFLVVRGMLIRGSSLNYAFNPSLPLNSACFEVAATVVKKDNKDQKDKNKETFLNILMPDTRTIEDETETSQQPLTHIDKKKISQLSRMILDVFNKYSDIRSEPYSIIAEKTPANDIEKFTEDNSIQLLKDIETALTTTQRNHAVSLADDQKIAGIKRKLNQLYTNIKENDTPEKLVEEFDILNLSIGIPQYFTVVYFFEFLNDKQLNRLVSNYVNFQTALIKLPKDQHEGLVYSLDSDNLRDLISNLIAFEFVLQTTHEKVRLLLCKKLGSEHLRTVIRITYAEFSTLANTAPKESPKGSLYLSLFELFSGESRFEFFQLLNGTKAGPIIKETATLYRLLILLAPTTCKSVIQITESQSLMFREGSITHSLLDFLKIIPVDARIDFCEFLKSGMRFYDLQFKIDNYEELHRNLDLLHPQDQWKLCQLIGHKHLRSLLTNGDHIAHIIKEHLPAYNHAMCLRALGGEHLQRHIQTYEQLTSLLEHLHVGCLKEFFSLLGEPLVAHLMQSIAHTIKPPTKHVSADIKKELNNKFSRFKKTLISLPLTVIDELDEHGRTLLHFRMMANDIESTWILLLKGASIHAKKPGLLGWLIAKTPADLSSRPVIKPLSILFTPIFQQHLLITQCQKSLRQGDYKTAFTLVGIAKQEIKSALLRAAVTGRLLLLLHNFCLAKIDEITPETENAHKLEQKWLERAETIEPKLDFYLDWQKVSEACTKAPAPSRRDPQAKWDAGSPVASHTTTHGSPSRIRR